eukprot:6197309-Pleurochrysis_carterae.AAC.4
MTETYLDASSQGVTLPWSSHHVMRAAAQRSAARVDRLDVRDTRTHAQATALAAHRSRAPRAYGTRTYRCGARARQSGRWVHSFAALRCSGVDARPCMHLHTNP